MVLAALLLFPLGCVEPVGHWREEEPEDDEETGDEVLAKVVPNANAEELVTLKARLREQGLWIRGTAKRRRGKLGLVKK